MHTLDDLTNARNQQLRTLIEVTVAALCEDGQKGYARLLFAQYAAVVDDVRTKDFHAQLRAGGRPMTVIETRIASWIRQLDNALAGVSLGRDFETFQRTHSIVWSAARQARLSERLERELEEAGSLELRDLDRASLRLVGPPL